MRFAKLHGAGNDFIVVEAGQEGADEERLAAAAPRLCHRRLGLGADGLLLLTPEAPGRVRVLYLNADGSRAAFCANGTRCAARFAARRWGWERVVLDTDHAAVTAAVTGSRVALELPPPEAVHGWHELSTGAGDVTARLVVVGVPHLVVRVAWEDFWERPLGPLAPALRHHPSLGPGGANVNFVRPRGPGGLEVRSFERGVEGETLSCGSGVVGAALVALAEGWVTGPVEVATASGRALTVEPMGEPPRCAVRLTGPAEWVADGEVAAELLAVP